ncbi:MAG: rhodanese-like domain-containing protein [Magnetococcales bacterium]|nr:rhodanese-like domain-containing protein [Magnetococcales bacterium]
MESKFKVSKISLYVVSVLFLASWSLPAQSAEEALLGASVATAQSKHALEVAIPEFTLNGTTIKQDRSKPKADAFKDPASRKCPPFCVQPDTLPGATTVRVEDFAKMAADINAKKILIVDMRTPDWFQKGTLPGAVSLPFSDLSGPEAKVKSKIKQLEGKDIIAFCNGWWCEQSPVGIKALVALGYAGKIYYFRDGNQGWVDAGLPLVTP